MLVTNLVLATEAIECHEPIALLQQDMMQNMW